MPLKFYGLRQIAVYATALDLPPPPFLLGRESGTKATLANRKENSLIPIQTFPLNASVMFRVKVSDHTVC